MTTISLSLRHAAGKTFFAACIAAFCWMPEPLGAQSPFPDENGNVTLPCALPLKK